MLYLLKFSFTLIFSEASSFFFYNSSPIKTNLSPRARANEGFAQYAWKRNSKHIKNELNFFTFYAIFWRKNMKIEVAGLHNIFGLKFFRCVRQRNCIIGSLTIHIKLISKFVEIYDCPFTLFEYRKSRSSRLFWFMINKDGDKFPLVGHLQCMKMAQNIIHFRKLLI